MTDAKVISFNGSITPATRMGEPNGYAVAAARTLLEQAESGEVVGVLLVKLHGDGLASFATAGVIGGYALVGATQCALLRLANFVDSE